METYWINRSLNHVICNHLLMLWNYWESWYWLYMMNNSLSELGHCCADFIAILTRGKNDLALFVFSLDQATFKISQLFWFAHKIGAQFCFPCQVQFSDFWLWILASVVPTNSSSFVHFAFVTFSALLFAFIYGFCLTLKEII